MSVSYTFGFLNWSVNERLVPMIFILTLSIPVLTGKSILPLLKLYISSSSENTKDDNDFFRAQEEVPHYAYL